MLPSAAMRPCSWHPSHVFCFADMRLPGDSKPWQNCPRGILQRALDLARTERGLEVHRVGTHFL